ncbi:hypothetical protein F4556_004487 [Kitasatospora gansuensis]|uniref:Secreted protein n=1 Tax=Kitasatospora gansuensis TaxID=258050 RepID=A0A7W7SF59_9ACTN|nr:DUF5719 family protein [Kitasatospora gansuensis]MBB4948952.1 hypothetical protein [Kitasatospora gansuensis]
MKKPTLKTPSFKAPELKAPALKALGGSRTGTSLLAGAVVLGVVFGIAELRPPVDPAGAVTGGATSAQVERTVKVCPQPLHGLTGTTQLSLFTPTGGTATGGYGALLDVAPRTPAAAPAPAAPASPSAGPSANPANVAPSDAKVALAKVGTPVFGPAQNGDIAPGTTATGTGGYAPGFAVGQTTTVTDQQGLGLSGIDCTPSDTSFWFSGASTAGDRVDYVSLVNAESIGAVVDLKFYGDKGPIAVEAADGIALAPGTSQALRLPSLIKDQKDLAIHVVARSGRVGAGLHAADGNKGADWVPASADPAPTQVLPGLMLGEGNTARLVVAAPGEDDADLKVQVSGKNGWFTPAGFETVHVKAGMVTALDLDKITRGEPGALRLSPSDPAHPTPVIATVRVDKSQNGKSDAAWITGATPIGKRGSLADNRGGGATTLFLTSTGDAAKVKVTSSAGSAAGTPATKDVDIPAGATVALPAPEPAGLNGIFGLTVETVSGGPVAAARMLVLPHKDVPMFTIQSIHDDHNTVSVPHADPDPAVLLR